MPPRSYFWFLGFALVNPAHAQLDFAHQIVPILREHCSDCHTGEEKKGGFSMNDREALLEGGENGEVLEIGNGTESWLIELITTDEKDIRMPPKGDRVPPEQVALLKQWIDDGLAWEPGFAFAKPAYEPPLEPREVALPAPQGDRTNPVDRLLDAYLAERNLPQPEPADDATFLRRLYLDVLGILPEPELLASFTADPDPQKRAKLIDDVLANNVAYADHWLTFWNDLLRNDYAGTGFITKGRTQITGWLYAALRENKPYDQFVRELLNPTEVSQGFVQGIKWRGDVNASQTVEVQFAQNISQVFLGINMKCASCHDSFIDRWKLEEAYNLAAIYATEPLEIHRCDKATGKMAEAGWIFPELGTIDPALPQPERLAKLAELMTHPQNGRLTRTIVNRFWHRLMGRGIVHPVDAMETEPWNANLLDFLATDLAAHDYDLKHSIRLIVSSQAYQSEVVKLEEELEASDYVYAGPLAKRMTAEQLVDAIWQLTDTAPKDADAKIPRKDTPIRASLVKSDFLMRSLGRPNREQVVTTRPAQLTTLQAIDLANGDVLAGTLQAGAQNLLKRDWASTDAFVTWLYEFALSRKPTGDELAALKQFAGSDLEPQTMEDLIWSVLMLPEFQMVR